MSQQARAGKIIRQSYTAFWKEWLLVAAVAPLILHPAGVAAWLEAMTGPGLLDGLPVVMLGRGAGLLVAAIAGGRIVYNLLANRYLLTDEEVVEVYGIIQRNRRVTRLEHIRRVSVRIGIMGRILGYGDVLYFTAGSGGVDVELKDIPNPEALAREADMLARQKQEEAEEDVSASGGTADRRGSGSAGGEILVALCEATSESVTVQREILAAIRDLRTETRRNASALQAALAGAEGSGFVKKAVGEHDLSDMGEHPGNEGASVESVPEVELGEHDDTSAAELDSEEEFSPPTPKMFDDWSAALAPESDRDPEHAPVERSESIPGRVSDFSTAEPEVSVADSPADSLGSGEWVRREELPGDGRGESDGSAGVQEEDSEFVGLMAHKKR